MKTNSTFWICAALLVSMFVFTGCQSEIVHDEPIVLSEISYSEQLTVFYFYQATCPVCRQMAPFLDALEETYDIQILRFELQGNIPHQQAFRQSAQLFGFEARNVPTTFIADKYFIGFSDSIADQITNLIQQCELGGCEELLK